MKPSQDTPIILRYRRGVPTSPSPHSLTLSARGRARRVRRAAAAIAVTGLVLAGCSVAEKDVVEVPTAGESSGSEQVAPELEPFYGQELAWSECGNFECATVTAPIDWDNPEDGNTEVALQRKQASGEAQGSLLINPGGPGGSGIEFLPAAVGMISPAVLDEFNIIGFDPRGVGESDPVQCQDDKAKDLALSKDYPTTPEGLKQMEADQIAFGEACLENTGALLGHVGTQSAAKDMDVIRALVGDEKLNYLGYSYGTQLGAAYAGLFPDKVGRLVLDGAVDITLDEDASNLEQAIGFERAARNYVEDCQGGADCPLTGSVDDGLAQIKTLVDNAFDNPFPTDGERRLTQTLAFYGIAVTLYDDQSWRFLTQGLSQALESNDGSTLMILADIYNDRNADGTYASNQNEAIQAIRCLDNRGNSDPEHMAEQAEKILEAAPTLGESFGYGALGCKNWPVPEVETTYDISAPGAAPILVIGTTSDPATPYEWSEALTETLDSATLLTWEGEGHTAYGRSNACIADEVDAYLLEGVVPAEGTSC